MKEKKRLSTTEKCVYCAFSKAIIVSATTEPEPTTKPMITIIFALTFYLMQKRASLYFVDLKK